MQFSFKNIVIANDETTKLSGVGIGAPEASEEDGPLAVSKGLRFYVLYEIRSIVMWVLFGASLLSLGVLFVGAPARQLEQYLGQPHRAVPANVHSEACGYLRPAPRVGGCFARRHLHVDVRHEQHRRRLTV